MPLLIWLLLGGGAFYVITKATPGAGTAPQNRSSNPGGGNRTQVAAPARVQMRKHATAANTQVWKGYQRMTGEEGNIADAERAIDQLAQKINETSHPIERMKFQRAYAHIDNWRARIAKEPQIYPIVDALIDPSIEGTQPTAWAPSARTRIEASHQARFTTLGENITDPCNNAWGKLDPVTAAQPRWVGGRSPVPVRGITPGTGSNVVMETVYSFYRGIKNIWTQGIRNLQYRGQVGSASPTGPSAQPFGYSWTSSSITPPPPAGGSFNFGTGPGGPPATDDSAATEPNIRGQNG